MYTVFITVAAFATLITAIHTPNDSPTNLTKTREFQDRDLSPPIIAAREDSVTPKIENITHLTSYTSTMQDDKFFCNMVLHDKVNISDSNDETKRRKRYWPPSPSTTNSHRTQKPLWVSDCFYLLSESIQRYGYRFFGLPGDPNPDSIVPWWRLAHYRTCSVQVDAGEMPIEHDWFVGIGDVSRALVHAIDSWNAYGSMGPDMKSQLAVENSSVVGWFDCIIKETTPGGPKWPRYLVNKTYRVRWRVTPDHTDHPN